MACRAIVRIFIDCQNRAKNQDFVQTEYSDCVESVDIFNNFRPAFFTNGNGRRKIRNLSEMKEGKWNCLPFAL
jgi:hypothetical protein